MWIACNTVDTSYLTSFKVQLCELGVGNCDFQCKGIFALYNWEVFLLIYSYTTNTADHQPVLTMFQCPNNEFD